MNPLIEYWYFHLPNFVLAAIMYSLMGRLVLSFFAPPNWKNYIWRAFVVITDPVVRLTRMLTPQVVPHGLVLMFGILWVMLLRLGVFLAFGNLGLLPNIAPA